MLIDQSLANEMQNRSIDPDSLYNDSRSTHQPHFINHVTGEHNV